MEPEPYLLDFNARSWCSSDFHSPLYSTSVRHRVRAGAVHGIFESMVELSDTANPMDKFLVPSILRMFMFGERNESLSYLGHLASNGFELANIPLSGHFLHVLQRPGDMSAHPRFPGPHRSTAAFNVISGLRVACLRISGSGLP